MQGAPAAALSTPRAYTYLVKVVLAVPEAGPEWKGQVKLVFMPDAEGVEPSFSPEIKALELSPKFRYGSAPQAVDFILQLQFPRGRTPFPVAQLLSCILTTAVM